MRAKKNSVVGLFAAMNVIALVTVMAPRALADSPTPVVVQGGTTPVDSGLYAAVIQPGFEAQYPQYDLQYVAVGTGQAITNAENGGGDAVFTHSPTLEASFVSNGYSDESGGRNIMTSDFVTVGFKSDPAHVLKGRPNDVVKAFQEIAAAGNQHKADFVSRGDQSGTNVKELAIWALTGIPLNTLGEPGPKGTTSTDSWYHTTGVGQAENVQTTNECPFSSGKCYTLVDRGTFNNLVTEGDVPNLEIVSQNNNGPRALGGPSFLLNPYHAYAVNPNKVPTVNLPGALAFLNFLTEPSTQQAIADFPSASNPAFTPDAYPDVTAKKVPKHAEATQTITVGGSAVPNYYLDPPLTGNTIDLIRGDNITDIVASTTIGSDGGFTLKFSPTLTDDYEVYMPESLDGELSPNTGFREPVTVNVGNMTVQGVPTLSIGSISGTSVSVSGTATPSTDRLNAQVQIQYLRGKKWTKLGSALPMPNGQPSYSTTVTLPSAGTWKLRALYTDPGAVQSGTSKVSPVTVS